MAACNGFGRTVSEGGANLGRTRQGTGVVKWDRRLDAEDYGMQAIRGFAIERTASSQSVHKDPFARAASMPTVRSNHWSLEDRSPQDLAPPKDQILRALEEISTAKPPASGLHYLEVNRRFLIVAVCSSRHDWFLFQWACKQCGLDGEFEKKKGDLLFSIGEFENEEEFSLEDMKADLNSGLDR
eukprot:CAMPEP_0196757306 /NCGR_PEP_ID=MMETSP1091-20130531/103599_1 /TAXON_ID=302021 /ORGANISM="Rhodomonas sp., Strain CCMP768" /LENGTH=183 /DNA_ID=CAMNT_0042106079 /DNA_START=99 /DNA_END=650 /DNA_ORIENTATION=-